MTLLRGRDALRAEVKFTSDRRSCGRGTDILSAGGLLYIPRGAARDMGDGKVADTTVWTRAYLMDQLRTAVLNPIQAFRLQYLPLLMVYFAYGALGLVSVAESYWIKKNLTLSPAELASLSVWLTLPWTIKMVFGELVDAVPVFGSQRRAYVLIGGTFIASGLLILAGAASVDLVDVHHAGKPLPYRLIPFDRRCCSARRDGGRHEHGSGGAHKSRL